MASIGEIRVKLDPRELILSLERFERMVRQLRPAQSVASPGTLAAAAMVAAGSTARVTRRSLLFGWFKK